MVVLSSASIMASLRPTIDLEKELTCAVSRTVARDSSRSRLAKSSPLRARSAQISSISRLRSSTVSTASAGHA